MNAYGAELWGAPGSSKPNSQLRLRKTNRGFTVTDTSDRLHNNAIEKAAKGMGILLVPMGAVVLMGQPSFQAGNVPLPSIAIAIGMALVGFALFVYANKGLNKELRIDPYKKEIRVGTVNSKGDFSLRNTITAADAQSFFLMRARPPAPAILCMRKKKGSQVIKLMKGPESDLIPVLERITEALRPKHMSNRRVRTRVTGAFIHASLG